MGLCYSCFRRRDDNDNERSNIHYTNHATYSYQQSAGQQQVIRTQPTSYNQQNHQEQIAREQARQEAEEKKKYEEERKYEEARRIREQKRREMLEKFNTNGEENDRERRRQEEERNARFERQMQSNREENARKDREMGKKLELLEEEMSKGYEVDDRRRKELEREREAIEDELKENQSKYDMEMKEKLRESGAAEQAHQARMQKISDDFYAKQEQLLRDAEYRQKEMEAQMEQIRRIFQMRMWSEIIESNWTNRLNTLRNANKDSQNMERLCLTSSDAWKLNEWRVVLEILLKMMKTESNNMTIMYSNTGKSFLLKIKSAVDCVLLKCQDLLNALDRSPDRDTLKRLSFELNNACTNIPTLAELKHGYYSEMQN